MPKSNWWPENGSWINIVTVLHCVPYYLQWIIFLPSCLSITNCFCSIPNLHGNSRALFAKLTFLPLFNINSDCPWWSLVPIQPPPPPPTHQPRDYLEYVHPAIKWQQSVFHSLAHQQLTVTMVMLNSPLALQAIFATFPSTPDHGSPSTGCPKSPLTTLT